MRLSWAKLLKRLFETVVEHRPNGGGQPNVIPAILEQALTGKILMHFLMHSGLQALAPPRAPACGHDLPGGA